MHSYGCIQNQIHIEPSGASLVMNLLMQNAMYIVQYVCCITHNVCTHRMHTKQMHIGSFGVLF